MKYIFIGILLLQIISCSSSNPKEIVPLDQMKKIMWDLSVSDELRMYRLQMDTIPIDKDTTYKKQYAAIFFHHNVSVDQFYASLAYYKKDPLLFRQLVDSVSAYGNRIKNESAKISQ